MATRICYGKFCGTTRSLKRLTTMKSPRWDRRFTVPENGRHRDTGDYGATVKALLDAGAKPPELTDDLETSEAALDALRQHASLKQRD